MITRFINAGGFAFILICFILPFISIKCNETTLASIKGYDMVFGKKNYLATQHSFFGRENNNNTEIINPDNEAAGDTNTENKEDSRHLEPSPLMIILLLVAVGGIIAAFAAPAIKAGIAGLAMSGIFLLVLLVIVISLNSKANGESSDMFGIIRIGYEIGFWLMLVSSLLLVGYNLFDILNARQKARVLSESKFTGSKNEQD
ncbi:MAG TPA: hypothetical protein VEC12_08065 [Bacteroidia bacterium]|nr:hypothetical protein [Bacteroidia bacterium]